MKPQILFLSLFASLFCTNVSQANHSIDLVEQDTIKIEIDLDQVKIWNKFTDSLYQLHLQQLKQYHTYTQSTPGGYATNKNFYIETKYFDSKTKRLLSQIQWEKNNKKTIHTIEVYIYDKKGRVIRDYISAYLPKYRNAPVQTLVNIHKYNKKLHSYRQFDASGYLIYEQCEGFYANNIVLLSFDEDEFDSNVFNSKEYRACFNKSPTLIGKYINPLVEQPIVLTGNRKTHKLTLSNFDELQNKITLYSKNISENNNNANNYLLRGNANFLQHNFFEAIDDYDNAIKLSNLDRAYLRRGMVKGRMGFIEDAISDLSVYIQRKPYDAFAYRKRGVRYICLGDIIKAEKDLTKAIQLDPNNAQAHDDLGIIFANRGDNETAKNYFISSISLDPKYRKSYHNLAMVYLLTGNSRLALQHIDQAVALSPESRNSLLLKSEILTSLGRINEASKINDLADFLPENNRPDGLPELN